MPKWFSQEGKTIGGYVFSGDSMGIFERVFGNASPFTDNFEQTEQAQADRVSAAKKEQDQPDNIEVMIECTI